MTSGQEGRLDTIALSPGARPTSELAVGANSLSNAGPRYTAAYCRTLPKFGRSVSVLCWAYNEEKLVAAYLKRIATLLADTVEDFEIVLIDDCSTDRTPEIAQSLQQQIPELRLIRNEANLNVGLSCRKAIVAAQKEYLFWQTIDWSYDIDLLRAYLELLKSYDVVAGVRRAPVPPNNQLPTAVRAVARLFAPEHLAKRSDTIAKAIISVCNYMLIRVLFSVPLSDYQNVCFYRTKLIQSFQHEARSSFVNAESLIKAYRRGCRIVEVPISFLPRQMGEAKGTRLKAVLNAIWDVWRLWFTWVLLGQRWRSKKGAVRRLRPDEWESHQ